MRSPLDAARLVREVLASRAAQQDHGAAHGCQQHEFLSQRIEAAEIEIHGADHIGNVACARPERVDGRTITRGGLAKRRQGRRHLSGAGQKAKARNAQHCGAKTQIHCRLFWIRIAAKVAKNSSGVAACPDREFRQGDVGRLQRKGRA
jgi:hypothetical protein